MSQAQDLAGEVRPALQQSASTDALWSAALLDLTLAAQDPSAADRAVGRLMEVTGREPALSAPLADLGLAFHARAAATGSMRDRFLALEYALRSFRRDSTPPASLFMVAILLDRVHLVGESIQAWKTTIASSPGEEWGAEAHNRLDNLRQRSSRAAPALRDSAFQAWLPRWAAAESRGDSAAARVELERIDQGGRALGARNADSSVLHATAAVQASQGSRSAGNSVLRGLSEYHQGATAFRAARFEEASSALNRAAVLLRASGSPALWGWPLVELGAVEVYRRNYDGADRIFREIHSAATRSGDVALAARALWGEALSLARRGALAQSERRYVRAAELYRTLKDSRNEGVVRSQLAQVYSVLGQPERVLDELGVALAAFEAERGSPYLHDLLVWLSTYLTDLGLVEAALAVQREDARVAPLTGRIKDLPEARTRLARAAANAGRVQEARRYVAEARDALGNVTDHLMRDRLEADLARAQADLEKDGDPAATIEHLGRAEKYFVAQGIAIELPPILVARARAHLAQGDTASAEGDLTRAVVMIDQRRREVAGPLARLSSVRSQADVFTALVTLQLARGDTLGALASAERARTDVGVSDSVPPTIEALTRRIPEGRVILGYLALPDRLLIWSLAADGVQLAESSATEPELPALVYRFVSLLRQRDDARAVTRLAADLYDRIVRPVRGRLQGRTDIVIAPDRHLQGVPFAALLDSATGRYLVQDASIRMTTTIAAGATLRPGRTERGRVLVVGDPAFDRALFPGLQPLKSARAEGDSVRWLHKDAAVLHGEQANRAALTSGLRGAALIHFAGHARNVALAPERSHLVLAAAPGGLDANVLYAADIAGLDLTGVDLVVLSACGSADGTFERGGPSGLAQAFAVAGARGVMSSLWEVDDAETTHLMTDFHRRLATGSSIAESLQQAQIAAIQAESDQRRAVSAWAAFRYEGH